MKNEIDQSGPKSEYVLNQEKSGALLRLTTARMGTSRLLQKNVLEYICRQSWSKKENDEQKRLEIRMVNRSYNTAGAHAVKTTYCLNLAELVIRIKGAVYHRKKVRK